MIADCGLRISDCGRAAVLALALAAPFSVIAQQAPKPKPAPDVKFKAHAPEELELWRLRDDVERLKWETLLKDKAEWKDWKFQGERFGEMAKELAGKARDFEYAFEMLQGPKLVQPPQPPQPPYGFGKPGKPGSDDGRYERAQRYLDERQWERAIERFDEVARMGGRRADGALYWKAYAQNKLGRRADALATIGELKKTHPQSRYLDDAKVLEVEVSQATGQPAPESDDEMIEMVLNNLMHNCRRPGSPGVDADSGCDERVIPVLEKLIRGNKAPRLKERALFLLVQTGSPKAREVVTQIARGRGNPDLQLKAVQYLGLYGGKESLQTLSEIYKSSSDIDAKRAILRSFMIAKDRERLLGVARSEPAPELRITAVEQLGVLNAHAELWQLYTGEQSSEVRERIIQSLFVARNSEKLIEVARNDKDPKLRRRAIQLIGVMRSDGSATATDDALVSIYGNEREPEVRRAVLDTFWHRRNAKALVDAARKESDPQMKRYIIERLSNMKAKEATDYLLELLNK